MGRRAARFGVFLLVCALAHSLSAAPQPKGLGLAQIKKLIEIHAPDGIVAGEVQSRGLGFQPTPEILSQLQQLGAGQATLAAIRERIPFATLEVDAPAGSQVALDGSSQGVVGGQNRLVVPNLLAGTHHLSIQKTGYQPDEITFDLAAHQYKRVAAELKWGGGYLTVQADPAGASINIPGLGQYTGGVSNLPCPPGAYDITVSRAGMKQQTRSVTVPAGQHVAVEIHLTPDPQFLANQLAGARDQLEAGNAQGAVRAASPLLSYEPQNPAVLGLLASAYLRLNDLEHFQMDAAEALRNKGSITLNLLHERRGLNGESVHPATLTLSSTSITYYPQEAEYKNEAFTAPLANVELTEITNKGTTGFIILRHLTPGTFLLHLEVRDPQRSDRRSNFYFATPTSRIVRVNNIGYIASSSDCTRVLTAIANVIRNAASAATHN